MFDALLFAEKTGKSVGECYHSEKKRLGLKGTGEFLPVHLGHQEIEQDEAGLLRSHLFENF